MKNDLTTGAWQHDIGCPIKIVLVSTSDVYTALHAIMYSPASSALVANDMTFLMMCAMFSTAPLFGGMVVSFDRKKCPLVLLRALGLLK